MKKWIVLLLCMVLLLCTACSKNTSGNKGTEFIPTDAPTSAPDLQDPTEPTLPEVPQESIQPVHAIALPLAQKSVIAEDGVEIFKYTCPQVQLFLHATEADKAIISNLQSRMSDIETTAEELELQAREDYPYSNYWAAYFIDVSYTPTRVDHAVLSLYGTRSTYSGGSHPSHATDSVTYDLESGIVLSLVDILESSCTGEKLGSLVLDALKPISDTLYYDYDVVVQDMFSSSYSGISQWYFSQTGLAFHFAPYEIAPYSSGTILVEVPYSKLSGVLLEKYMPILSPNATGSMYTELAYSDAAQFSNELNVKVGNGDTVLLYTDDTVTNVRIEQGTWYSDGSQFVATSTVFAADSLSIGNAIRLTADFGSENTAMRLVYHSADQEVSAFIIVDAENDSAVLAHG